MKLVLLTLILSNCIICAGTQILDFIKAQSDALSELRSSKHYVKLEERDNSFIKEVPERNLELYFESPTETTNKIMRKLGLDEEEEQNEDPIQKDEKNADGSDIEDPNQDQPDIPVDMDSLGKIQPPNLGEKVNSDSPKREELKITGGDKVDVGLKPIESTKLEEPKKVRADIGDIDVSSLQVSEKTSPAIVSKQSISNGLTNAKIQLKSNIPSDEDTLKDMKATSEDSEIVLGNKEVLDPSSLQLTKENLPMTVVKQSNAIGVSHSKVQMKSSIPSENITQKVDQVKSGEQLDKDFDELVMNNLSHVPKEDKNMSKVEDSSVIKSDKYPEVELQGGIQPVIESPSVVESDKYPEVELQGGIQPVTGSLPEVKEEPKKIEEVPKVGLLVEKKKDSDCEEKDDCSAFNFSVFLVFGVLWFFK